MVEPVRGGRPPAMTSLELELFLRRRPSGALHVVGTGENPYTLPARIMDAELGHVDVVIPAFGGELVDEGAEACVVGDEFQRYEDIRGVIVQGVVERVSGYGTEASRVRVRRDRVTTFAFGPAVRGRQLFADPD